MAPGFQLNQVSPITDYLFLSGYSPVTDKLIADASITCIIDATNFELTSKYIQYDPKNLDDYLRIPLEDDENSNLAQFFEPVNDMIERHRKNGGRTLVHCRAGISRSATLCMAYLVKYGHKSLKNAYIQCRARRRIIRPNDGFWEQLIRYEKEIRQETTVRFIPGRVFGQILGVLFEEEQKWEDWYGKTDNKDENTVAIKKSE